MFSSDGDLVLMRAFGRPLPGEAAGRLWKLEGRIGGGETGIEPKGGTALEEEFGRVPKAICTKRTNISIFTIQPWSICSLYLMKRYVQSSVMLFSNLNVLQGPWRPCKKFRFWSSGSRINPETAFLPTTEVMLLLICRWNLSSSYKYIIGCYHFSCYRGTSLISPY